MFCWLCCINRVLFSCCASWTSCRSSQYSRARSRLPISLYKMRRASSCRPRRPRISAFSCKNEGGSELINWSGRIFDRGQRRNWRSFLRYIQPISASISLDVVSLRSDIIPSRRRKESSSWKFANSSWWVASSGKRSNSSSSVGLPEWIPMADSKYATARARPDSSGKTPSSYGVPDSPAALS